MFTPGRFFSPGGEDNWGGRRLLDAMLTQPLRLLRDALVVIVVGAPTTVQAEGGAGAIDAFRQADATITALSTAETDVKAATSRTDRLLDYAWLARESLGGPKGAAAPCGKRCDEYERLLGAVVRRRYLAAAKARSTGSVAYRGAKVDKASTTVRTRVTLPGRHHKDNIVEIDYVMHRVGGDWAVRDIVTDGVRMSAVYRARFVPLLREGGIGAVIADLHTTLHQPTAHK